MIQINDIVRLSTHLFPTGDTAEEQWNNRIVRVSRLICSEVIQDNNVWRVEPEKMQDKHDYLHVHSYEMSPAFGDTTTEETSEV